MDAKTVYESDILLTLPALKIQGPRDFRHLIGWEGTILYRDTVDRKMRFMVSEAGKTRMLAVGRDETLCFFCVLDLNRSTYLQPLAFPYKPGSSMRGFDLFVKAVEDHKPKTTIFKILRYEWLPARPPPPEERPPQRRVRISLPRVTGMIPKMKNLAIGESSSAKNHEPKQARPYCSALCKSTGKPCQRKAAEGQRYCSQHMKTA